MTVLKMEMVNVFWGKKGIILLDFISNSVTINSKMNVSTFLNLGARLH